MLLRIGMQKPLTSTTQHSSSTSRQTMLAVFSHCGSVYLTSASAVCSYGRSKMLLVPRSQSPRIAQLQHFLTLAATLTAQSSQWKSHPGLLLRRTLGLFYKHANITKLLVVFLQSILVVWSVSFQKCLLSQHLLWRLPKKVAFWIWSEWIMTRRLVVVSIIWKKRKATLNISAFSKGSNLSKTAVKCSRSIASVCIHVQRVFRAMKFFRILFGMILPPKLRFCLSQILRVVSMLSDLDKPLCYSQL